MGLQILSDQRQLLLIFLELSSRNLKSRFLTSRIRKDLSASSNSSINQNLIFKSQFIELFGDPISNSKSLPIKQLSELASSRLGKMLDAKKQTGKHRHPYLANFNVQWFYFDFSTLNQMDFDEADQIEFSLENGDLMVCEGGEVGRCAIWRGEIKHCYFQKAFVQYLHQLDNHFYHLQII